MCTCSVWPQSSRNIISVLHSEMLCLINQNMVAFCTTCQRHRISNPKKPMIAHQIPDGPWQAVVTDLFKWDGSNLRKPLV